jgi:hypothetical protein
MTYRRSTSTSPRTIRAKFAGECACCGAAIAAGEMCDYYPARKQIAHIGGLDGNSSRCASEIRKANERRDFIDIDRLYEDQCAEICGR